MAMNITEKILARASGKTSCVPGEIVEARIDVAMLHDIGTPGIQGPLRELEVETLPPSVEVVIIPDHFVPAPTVQAANNLKLTREFAKKHKIESYYELGRGGICHQVMAEKGHARPGEVIIGPDSHTTTYGAFGAFAVGLGVTDTAIGLGLGTLWFRVPPTVRIALTGRLRKAVSAKDISLFLLKEFGTEALNYKAVELAGTVIAEMTIDGRMCICDIAAEMGAKNCIIAPDQTTLNYLRDRTKKPLLLLTSDPDARYEEVKEFDVSDLEPLVACPHLPTNVKPVNQVQGIRIHQAFLGSCTNGRIEDLRIAAAILKDRKVHPDVRLIVTPASQEIYLDALKEGLWEIFVEAGALITNPSCGACFGGHMGLLADGEACISTANRNFLGRMGSTRAEIYLASPATVAASAIAGVIANPSSAIF